MIIAHRGASYDAPENTVASINLAWEQKADAIEVDVHLSKDNHVIVIHDYTTKRTTGKDLAIYENTLETIQQLDAGSWKNPKWRDVKIPSLKEVLQTIPENKKIFIEIKSGAECLPEMEKLLLENNLAPHQITIMDFDLDTVIRAREEFPETEVLWLYEFFNEENSNAIKEKLIEIIEVADKYKLTGVNIEDIEEFDKSFIQMAKVRGLKCYCWTVDDPVRVSYLIESGIDGITTNRPGWMREELEKIFSNQ
jgi:glycerophosphoryl diester phosphodiesterase